MDLSNEIVVQENINGVEVLRFRRLLEYPNLKHAYALKPLNFRRLDGEDSKYNEYEKFLKAVEINPITLVKPNQTHSDNILKIEKKQNKNLPDIYLEYLDGVDASITNKPQITLASTNADCILIMFYDKNKNVIANVHSGWRGTFQKIAQKTVRKMKEEYNSNPEDIIACICPAIRVCHFEVDTDVKEECEKIFKYTNRLDEIIKRGRVFEEKQKYNIDTILINKILLKEEGLKEENILDSGICSVCSSEKVHSRRVEGANFGVGSAVIALDFAEKYDTIQFGEY